MLTLKDLQAIRQIVKEEVQDQIENNPVLERKFKGIDEKFIRLDLRMESLENRLNQKIDQTKIEIIREVGIFVNDFILPALDEKADLKRVKKIEAHLGINFE